MSLPDLTAVRLALAEFATADAVQQLEAAVASLRQLESSLAAGPPPAPDAQRALQRSLHNFQSELRAAGALATQGLAYCRDWSESLAPPSTYQPHGVPPPPPSAPSLSLEG